MNIFGFVLFFNYERVLIFYNRFGGNLDIGYYFGRLVVRYIFWENKYYDYKFWKMYEYIMENYKYWNRYIVF